MMINTLVPGPALIAAWLFASTAGVPNTKHPSTRPPTPTNGTASLVFHYMGDNDVTTLFQETVHLKKAMSGYNKVILLKHDNTPQWLDWSEKDEQLADVIALPTYQNLAKYLKQLTAEGYAIDLWIMSHGKSERFKASTGTFGSEDWITGDEIRSLTSATGYSTLPLRMVYSWACFGSTLLDDFQAIGAKVVCGARYINFYPTQFGAFADAWNEGNVSFANCLERSDTASSRTAVQTYLAMIYAPANNKKWGSCPFGSTILGDKDCAEDFFRWAYGLCDPEWKDSKSGKENMNYSSEMSLQGDGSVTKRTKPTWS